MTNEELAVQIQLGHAEHYGILWANCQKLLFMILREKVKGLPLPNYITADDMRQEMYFALCKAVQAYDDTKPYTFNSYLNYSVMNALRECIPNDHIKESSYNQTVRGCDDSEECELIDLIADEAAAESFERIELTDAQRITRQAVAALPKRERQAVELHYFKGLTYKQIAKIDGVSVKTVKARVNKVHVFLRRNRALLALYDEFRAHYRFRR